MTILVIQRLFFEWLWHLVYFPIWWCTGGVVFFGKKILSILRSFSEQLAPGLWLRHIFTPMFGQYDLEGRLVSFFVRLFNVIIRSLILSVITLVLVFVFLLWFLIPAVVLMHLLRSFIGIV